MSLQLIERDPDEVEQDNGQSTAKVHAAEIDTGVSMVKSPKEVRPPVEKKRRLTLPPCIHLGDVTREEGCRLCGGRRVVAQVHSCALHGECTQSNYGLRGNAKFLATCVRCRDYSEIGGLATVPK